MSHTDESVFDCPACQDAMRLAQEDFLIYGKGVTRANADGHLEHVSPQVAEKLGEGEA